MKNETYKSSHSQVAHSGLQQQGAHAFHATWQFAEWLGWGLGVDG